MNHRLDIRSLNLWKHVPTLDSGVGLGPMFINFVFFPGPMALLKALCLLIFEMFSRLKNGHISVKLKWSKKHFDKWMKNYVKIIILQALPVN